MYLLLLSEGYKKKSIWALEMAAIVEKNYQSSMKLLIEVV